MPCLTLCRFVVDQRRDKAHTLNMLTNTNTDHVAKSLANAALRDGLFHDDESRLAAAAGDTRMAAWHADRANDHLDNAALLEAA